MNINEDRMYTPFNWVILKFDHKKLGIYYKVLGGWIGGYLEGNSWRLNSGIKSVKEGNNCYYFDGYSGSIYKCRKDSEEVRMNIAGTIQSLQEQVKTSSLVNSVEVIPVEQLIQEMGGVVDHLGPDFIDD